MVEGFHCRNVPENQLLCCHRHHQHSLWIYFDVRNCFFMLPELLLGTPMVCPPELYHSILEAHCDQLIAKDGQSSDSCKTAFCLFRCYASLFIKSSEFLVIATHVNLCLSNCNDLLGVLGIVVWLLMKPAWLRLFWVRWDCLWGWEAVLRRSLRIPTLVDYNNIDERWAVIQNNKRQGQLWQ